MIEPDGPHLPASLLEAVRHEFGRTFHLPFDTLIVVAVNAALMSSAWFFLPAGLKDKVFTIHGTLAFAVVLAAWMYADVPATNVLGPDAGRVIAAIDDPVMLRRLLDAKSILLWSVVTPVCLVVAVVTAVTSRNYLAALYSAVWIGIVPFGVLSLSGWVGNLFPYHPMPVRYRWEHRRPLRRMMGRWLALVLIPYGFVPLLGVLMMTPSLLVWGLTSPHGITQRLPDRDLGVGVALACVVAAACSFGGRRISCWMIARRRAKLLAFLADPTRG
jgi:hypothetical protein